MAMTASGAMYRGGRANATARRLARLWAAVFGLGLMPRRWVTLEVVGRRSGRVVRFPLGMADQDGQWYLVIGSPPSLASGQAEEQLLHLLLGHRGVAVAGQALPHPARHDLESGPVQARETAASWVTTSAQSRPFSIIAMTPASWPWARRSRLSTGVMACSSTFIGWSFLPGPQLFLARCQNTLWGI
jgi:hypothetical protein